MAPSRRRALAAAVGAVAPGTAACADAIEHHTLTTLCVARLNELSLDSADRIGKHSAHANQEAAVPLLSVFTLGFSDMHLFTWNIGGRFQMLPYAFAYLERIARSDRIIATLQEWPDSVALPALGSHGLTLVPREGKAIILHSSDLVLVQDSLDSSGRATIARLRLPSGNEITCVGLHWYSRDSRGGLTDHYERGGAMALFRHHLESRLDQSTPAVLMGDFNFSGQEGEMFSPYCLYARTARHRGTSTTTMIMGQQKKAWALVEPDMPKHMGTFYWKAKQAWHILDHIVLTPDLVRAVVSAEVLTELEGHTFLTKKQVPRTKRYASDHLPLVCRIHYQ